MDFIKLTYSDDTAVYVNADKIAVIDREGDKATTVYFTVPSDDDFMRWIRVKETPEEILKIISRNYQIFISEESAINACIKESEEHN